MSTSEFEARVIKALETNGIPLSGSSIQESEAVPIKQVSVKTSSIQTHNAVSVGASSTSTQGVWIDCLGFREISLTLLNDASTTSQANIIWSNDGVSDHGIDSAAVPSNTASKKTGNTRVKARYAKIQVQNGDASPHTISCWAYLIA